MKHCHLLDMTYWLNKRYKFEKSETQRLLCERGPLIFGNSDGDRHRSTFATLGRKCDVNRKKIRRGGGAQQMLLLAPTVGKSDEGQSKYSQPRSVSLYARRLGKVV